jgi:hypothetical protein
LSLAGLHDWISDEEARQPFIDFAQALIDRRLQDPKRWHNALVEPLLDPLLERPVPA